MLDRVLILSFSFMSVAIGALLVYLLFNPNVQKLNCDKPEVIFTTVYVNNMQHLIPIFTCPAK